MPSSISNNTYYNLGTNSWLVDYLTAYGALIDSGEVDDPEWEKTLFKMSFGAFAQEASVIPFSFFRETSEDAPNGNKFVFEVVTSANYFIDRMMERFDAIHPNINQIFNKSSWEYLFLPDGFVFSKSKPYLDILFINQTNKNTIDQMILDLTGYTEAEIRLKRDDAMLAVSMIRDSVTGYGDFKKVWDTVTNTQITRPAGTSPLHVFPKTERWETEIPNVYTFLIDAYSTYIDSVVVKILFNGNQILEKRLVTNELHMMYMNNAVSLHPISLTMMKFPLQLMMLMAMMTKPLPPTVTIDTIMGELYQTAYDGMKNTAIITDKSQMMYGELYDREYSQYIGVKETNFFLRDSIEWMETDSIEIANTIASILQVDPETMTP